MPATSKITKLIRIKIEQGWSGGFFASSPDLKGLHVAAPSRQALEQMIPQFIADLFLAAGEPMIVSKIDPSSGSADEPWVAMPVSFAEAAIAAQAGQS